MREVSGFNAKLAVLITHVVGSMWCAYFFALLALLSLPAALSTGQLIVIVAWIAQTFLQLVLLSVIMVGQQVAGAAQDARAETEFTNVVTVLKEINEIQKELISLKAGVGHLVREQGQQSK